MKFDRLHALYVTGHRPVATGALPPETWNEGEIARPLMEVNLRLASATDALQFLE